MEPLKLAALDADDLDVISAHLQDAIFRVGDIKYVKSARRLALTANRFAWEAATPERRRSALQFDRVVAVKSHKIALDDPGGVLSLLSISFAAAGEPSGAVTLNFSGGGMLKLDVECVEARLTDLGPAWDTAKTPSHGK